jgi:hypothetical protein
MRSFSSTSFGVIFASILFGIAVAVLKGGDAGVRDSIGNVSAPWLLLPYFAGATTRGWGRGAVMGAAACLAALAGFYSAEAFVLDLGGHPVLTNLALTLSAGRMYFAAGIICGPLCGAIGAVGSKVHALVTPVVVALTLVGEPVAVFAWLRSVGIESADTGMVTAYPFLWIAEMALGLGLAAAIIALGPRRQANRRG